MKFEPFLLALCAATAVTPTLAASGFSYPTLLAEFDVEGSWDNAAEIKPEPGFFGTIKLAGGLNISLDRTPLQDIAHAFDTGIQTYQYAGYTTSWLCYTHAGRRVWFIVDLTYETTDEVNVSMIIDEPADPVTDALFLCADQPGAMLTKPGALPVIGTTRDELNTRFKAQIPAGATRVTGMSDAAIEDSGIYDMKIVTYRLKNDAVDAIYIAEDYNTDDEVTE
ncbi:MAG: hypothetical protein ABIQ30_06330 [Devosia sp.]